MAPENTFQSQFSFNQEERQEPQQDRPPLLMLMDGHAMVHRSFHAISVQRHLTVRSTGEDVTGVYGFTNVFLRALQEWKPDLLRHRFRHVGADLPAPTLRPVQSAAGGEMPEELEAPVRTGEATDAGLQRVPVFELDGYEADDRHWHSSAAKPRSPWRQHRNSHG